MSCYATIGGTIRYAQPSDFETAVRLLQSDGWLDEEGFLVDETGTRITEERSNVNRDLRTIEFPTFHYRNLIHVLANLFVGGSGKVVWTSTDGCFDAGVIVDGVETTYDLAAWNTVEGGESAPDIEADFDEYVEWMAEIEEAFIDKFGE